MAFKLTRPQKWMFWAFGKSILQFFAGLCVTKLKPFSGKVSQTVPNYLNQTLFIRNFLGNGFEATLSSKKNVLSVWKGHFSVFSKVLSDEVEKIFWESEAKRSKLFKSRFVHMKLLRKWVLSYLELENQCCEHLKTAFFRVFLGFFWIFQWRKWNHFLGKSVKAFKTIWMKIWS